MELKVRCEIKSVKVIKNQEKSPIIIAEIEDYDDKMLIMKNKNALRENKKMIYIENDWTKEERRRQAEIRKTAKEEKGKGKTVKVRYNKLLVGEKVFIWSETKDGLEEQQMNITEDQQTKASSSKN